MDTDEIWCERNPYGNERDQSLVFSWNSFCDVVKHRRRFFFQHIGEKRDDLDDSLSPAELLQEIAEIVNRLIASVPGGLRFGVRATGILAVFTSSLQPIWGAPCRSGSPAQ